MSDKLRQLSGKKWERRGNNYVHKLLKSASRDMGVSEFRQNLTVNFYKTLAIRLGQDLAARKESHHGHAWPW